MVIDTGINYNLTAGTSVGLQPTYQWNAKVTSGTIQIYDAEGNAVADSYTSEGDHITILSICPSEYTQLSLALIQFPDQSNSCYIQGYIQTSDFNLLECRFNNSWVDTTNNQQIIFANGDLADRTLNAGDYQTYLYTTDNYACISFLNDNNAFKSGFVPLNSGNLNIIETDIPFYLAPGSSVGTKLSYPSNATTIASQIEIVDINGITIPNNYTSNGDNITILDVYTDEKLALIEFPDSYTGTYIIGYVPVSNIGGNIKLKQNYCNWTSLTQKYSIYDLQKSVIYKIESSQTTQYLFKTNTYACILFNNNNITNWPLETGFVSLDDGKFGLGESSNIKPASSGTGNTKPPTSGNDNNGGTVEVGMYGVVTYVDGINVYSNCDITSNITGSLPVAQRFKISDITEDMYKISMPQQGWIEKNKTYVQVEEITKVSSKLVDFTASYEGFRSKPYKDIAGYWTIGYGDCLGRNYPGDITMTQAQAWTLLESDLNGKYANGILQYTQGMNLTQSQFDSLVDFAYNLGVGSYEYSCKTDGLGYAIENCGTPSTIISDFQAWSYAGGAFSEGIYRRRTAESQMFLYDEYNDN